MTPSRASFDRNQPKDESGRAEVSGMPERPSSLPRDIRRNTSESIAWTGDENHEGSHDGSSMWSVTAGSLSSHVGSPLPPTNGHGLVDNPVRNGFEDPEPMHRENN